MLYLILCILGPLAEAVAIWLAIHSHREAKRNTAIQHENTMYLMTIMEEVHAILVKENANVPVRSGPEEHPGKA